MNGGMDGKRKLARRLADRRPREAVKNLNRLMQNMVYLRRRDIN